MTLPHERTRAVIRARDFLARLSSPYLPDGIKRVPSEVRDEARRLLRHYPTLVDMAHAADQFDAEEARRHYP
jgi:hypothetical protein